MNEEQHTPTLRTVLIRRGLNREEAATYVGISARKFDALVADGRMPSPIRVDARRIWDRHQLDDAFDELKETDKRAVPPEWALPEA